MEGPPTTTSSLTVSTSASYRRVLFLAKGGMGSVELVVRKEGTFSRLYALKRPHPHFREDAEVQGMFLEEARISGLLRHPNVVSVVDVGKDSDGPFLVMDYVDGVSLGNIVKAAAQAKSFVPMEVCLRIAIQTAEGLDAAHRLTDESGMSLQLVHRDISPHNILVGYDGIARVSDFGIAKALGTDNKTSTGILKGKLGYMSPEQLQFLGPTPKSDLFSLGVVLFETLAAQRLYKGEQGDGVARRILKEAPPDLAEYRGDAPPELVGLLFRLLAKKPEARPESALAVARELEAILRDWTATAESVVETRDYLAQHFGAARTERQGEIARAMEEASAPPTTGSGLKGASRVTIGILLAAVLGLGILAMVFWKMKGKEPTPVKPVAVAAPSAAPATPVVAAAPVAPTPAPVVDAGTETEKPSAPTKSHSTTKHKSKKDAMGTWEWQ